MRPLRARAHDGTATVAAGEWSRARLWTLLVTGVVVAVALLAGAAWAVAALAGLPVPGGASDHPRDATVGDAPAGRGLSLGEDAVVGAVPGRLSTGDVGSIRLPAATSIGAAGVPTGFPPTREGALAQLIAIDRAALESTSVPRAQDVIARWAAPGGPDPESWTVVIGLSRMLSAAQQPATGTTSLRLRADAAMALYAEATSTPADGGAVTRTTPCVDFVLTLTVGTSSEQVAVADCQRMTWVRSRWVIAPGDEPDPSPSLWPGSQASLDAGYRWLEVAP